MNVSYIKPKFVRAEYLKGYIISAFIEETIINKNNAFTYTDINVGMTLEYGTIVSALVGLKFTQDQITAITLNYLLTLHGEVLEPEKIAEYQQDYKELQEYRAACKAEAKRAIEYADINDVKP